MSPERQTAVEYLSISDDDRLLTEVDHLLSRGFGPDVLTDVRLNLITSIQEQAMPAAITETRHEVFEDIERKERIFMWMGKTAVQNAMSGYSYHRHESALARVSVEVDEAEYAATQTEDTMRVFISPRMTRKDATLTQAREEHLGDDDAVRISWLETNNSKTERILQSLLVKDVPFEAWVAMLEDGNNIFGKEIGIEDKESSLSVLKAHRQLELQKGTLKNGPVSIVEAVVPYISDSEARKKVVEQVHQYIHKDQEQMRRDAEAKADEWLEFEKELALSLRSREATPTIAKFVADLHAKWSQADFEVIQKHTYDGTLKMSRQLAAVLESAEQRLLTGRAAVLADEEFVLKQLGSVQVLRQMQDTERLIMIAQQEGMNYQRMVMQQNHQVAEQGIKAGGGGCAGENKTSFSNDKLTAESLNLPDALKKEFETQEDEESDDLGNRNFECTKGHKNYRRIKNVPEEICRVCGEVVSCKPKPEQEKQKKRQKATGFALLFKVDNEQFAAAA